VGHVPRDHFAATVAAARRAGFEVAGHPRALFSRCVLLTKS
jgi:hypothetical protein